MRWCATARQPTASAISDSESSRTQARAAGSSACGSVRPSPLPVEVDAADALEVLARDQPPGRVEALLDGADRLHAVLAHHRGVHEGGRVQRGDGDSRADQVGGEVVGRHHLGQLGAAVGRHPVVRRVRERVLAVQGELTCRGDLDDAGRRARPEQRAQPRREAVRGEVVDGEPELDPVGALLAASARGAEAHPRVVDQHVQGVVAGDQLVGEPVHVAELGEVGLHRVDVLTGGRLDLGHQLGEPVRRPSVRDDVGAVLGEPVGRGRVRARRSPR